MGIMAMALGIVYWQENNLPDSWNNNKNCKPGFWDMCLEIYNWDLGFASNAQRLLSKTDKGDN